jgi:hypothetical protein
MALAHSKSLIFRKKPGVFENIKKCIDLRIGISKNAPGNEYNDHLDHGLPTFVAKMVTMRQKGLEKTGVTLSDSRN